MVSGKRVFAVLAVCLLAFSSVMPLVNMETDDADLPADEELSEDEKQKRAKVTYILLNYLGVMENTVHFLKEQSGSDMSKKWTAVKGRMSDLIKEAKSIGADKLAKSLNNCNDMLLLKLKKCMAAGESIHPKELTNLFMLSFGEIPDIMKEYHVKTDDQKFIIKWICDISDSIKQ